MISPSSSRAGLTLIELMLAMVMTSLLALSLYVCLQTAFKARERACAAVEPIRAAQVALEMIGADLESAMMPTGILAGSFLGTNTAAGGIDSGALEFYSVGPGSAQHYQGVTALDPTQAGGIRKVDVLAGILQGDTRPALVRRVTRNLLAPRAVEPEDEILCRGIASFTARYFDGSVWTDTWDSTQLSNALPLLVELSIVLQQGQGGLQAGYPRFTRICSLACWQDPATKKAGS